MKSRRSQRLLPVLLQQDRIILKRHLGPRALKRRASQRVDIPKSVLMEILALPDARILRVQSAKPRDIDIKPSGGIDPPRIDYVQSLAALALSGPWVYVEEVGAFHAAVLGLVGDYTAVEVVG